MRYRLFGLTSLLTVTVLTGTGCGKTTTVVNNDQMQVKSNAQNGQYEFINKETGETMNIGSTKLAPNFPTDIPILPNTTLVMSSVVQGTASAILRSSQSVDDAAAWYTKTLTDNKWTISNGYNVPGIQSFDATNGSGATIYVVVGTDQNTPAGDNQSTTITLTRSEAAAQQ